jgi:nucleotide-binding universal stress UspA family protein
MNPPRLILCATDGQPTSDLALLEAEAWAKRYGASLSFVCAIADPSRTNVLFPHLARKAIETMPAVVRLSAENVALRVEKVTSRPRALVDVRVDVGSPAAIIVAAAEEMGADLIIMAAVGRADAVAPLGAVALRVVQHAHCPVLVVRPGPASGPVLAATDLSDSAYPAIGAGAAVAKSLDAELAVIHVADLPRPMPVAPEAAGLGIQYAFNEEEFQLLREAARDHLHLALSRAGAAGQCIVDQGLPASCVVSAARRLGARLLVIGTEGRTGLRRMLLGSTAEQILRDAPCSVLVVRLHTKGGPS